MPSRNDPAYIAIEQELFGVYCDTTAKADWRGDIGVVATMAHQKPIHLEIINKQTKKPKLP